MSTHNFSDDNEFTLYSGESENWRTLFEIIPDAAFITSYDEGRILAANRAAERTYNYSLEQMLGSTTLELGIFQDTEQRAQALAVINGGACSNSEVIFWRGGCEKRVGEFSIQRVNYKGIECLLILGRDVTELRKASQELKESETRYRLLLENTTDIPWRLDTAGNILYIAPSISALGYNAKRLIGCHISTLLGMGATKGARRAFERILREFSEAEIRERLLIYDTRGNKHHFEVSVVAVKDHFGVLNGFQGIARDITEQVMSEERLKRLAMTDELTGLSNRRGFMQALESAIADTELARGRHALMSIDLDDFKLVNDRFGHDAGDRCLIHLAKRLQGAVRPEDIVARFGGDEFAVLLCDVNLKKIKTICERILDTLKTKRGNEPACFEMIGTSIGVAFADGGDIQSLLKRADDAMYESKRRGKQTYYIDPGAGISLTYSSK